MNVISTGVFVGQDGEGCPPGLRILRMGHRIQDYPGGAWRLPPSPVALVRVLKDDEQSADREVRLLKALNPEDMSVKEMRFEVIFDFVKAVQDIPKEPVA